MSIQKIQALISEIRAAEGAMTAEIRNAERCLAVVQALVRRTEKLCCDFENHMVALSIAEKVTEIKTAGAKPVDLKIYRNDDYSRVGCTLVINIFENKWGMRVYAPGYVSIGGDGMIESYAYCSHGSTGICVDAFIQRGSDLRHALPAMKKAERAYAAASGSVVTA